MELGWIIHVVLIAGGGLLLLPHCIRFLHAHQRVEQNYRGDLIPTGLGIYIWLLVWLQELLLSLYTSIFPELTGLAAIRSLNNIYVLAVTIILAVGWLDDTIGHKHIKGLRGHLTFLLQQGTISMGIVKIVGFTAVSIWVLLQLDMEPYSFFHIGLKLMLILLMTNGLNLLDVRPGRALKVFMLMAVGAALFFVELKVMIFMLPVVVGGMILFPYDVRGRLMLGDTGANLVGFSLGFWFMIGAPVWVEWMLVIGGVTLHIVAEKSSMTRLIENNRLLNWLDRLGRV
ncbi:Glycosyl transferase family 4 [compost metagenome]